MFNRIADGFLTNFVELNRCILRKRRNMSFDGERTRNGKHALHVNSKLLEDAGQFIAVDVERGELAREVVGVINDFLNQRLKPLRIGSARMSLGGQPLS